MKQEKVNPDEIIVTEVANESNTELETPNNKSNKGFFSTKKGKIILFSLIGIVVIGAIIAIVVALGNKDEKIAHDPDTDPVPDPDTDPDHPDPDHPDPVPDPDPNPDPNPDPDPTVININYKKNDVSVYTETREKTSNIELNENIKLPGRRVEEGSKSNTITKKTIIQSKYLLNIYDEKTENSLTTYYAYASILSMDKKVGENKVEVENVEDIRVSSNVNDKTPVVKFTFDQYGTISNFQMNENMDSVLASYLYEFVEKVIPEVLKTSFTRRLDEDSRKFEGDKNNGVISQERNRIPSDGDEEKISWKTTIENNKVKEVSGSKDLSIVTDSDNQMSLDYNNNNFTNDVQNDENANRKSNIKKITNTLNSKISLSDDSSNDETITEQVSNLLNNLEFVNYKNEERRLESISKGFSNLRNLQEFTIDTFHQPIYYTFPIFRSHLLGAKIGLIAVVSFQPVNDKILMQMLFDAGDGKPPRVIFKEEKKMSFNNIVNGISDITNKIYVFLEKKDFNIQPIFDEHEQKITTQLNVLHNYIKDYPLLVNVFRNELNRILQTVNEATANCYNDAHDYTRYATGNFSNLKDNIINKNDEYVNAITNSSYEAIQSFITTNKKNLDTLFSSWSNFHDEAIPFLIDRQSELERNKSFTVDIGLYYNIKDEMKNILAIYKDFTDNLKNALNVEQNKFKIYADNEFDSLIDPELRKSEVIAENANNNVSVIDAMNIYFGKPKGDEIRKKMIEQIGELRTNLKGIMDEVFTQISKIYSDKLSSDEFTEIVNDIQSKYEEVYREQEDILKELRVFNKYDINFDIYFDDIRVLNDLELKANEEKKESYNEHIAGHLNNQSDYFLTETETNEIKDLILDLFKNLTEYVSNGDWDIAKDEATKLKDIVNSINKKYLNESLGKRVINYYTNTDFINSMINNYYKDIDTAYAKFNTSFFKTNYELHKDQYISKPTEIINRILSISYALNPENSQLHKLIKNLIVQKIRLGITTTTYEVYEMILNEYNSLIQSYSNNKCCLNGYNLANLKQLKDILLEFQSIYIDQAGRFIPLYLYNPKNVEDEFGLKAIILVKEKKIRSYLKRISDKINNDFLHTFCQGDELICAYEKVVNSIEHYLYQASKLRVSLQFLQSLVNVAQSMIGDNILSDLSPQYYGELFENELRFRGTEISTDIDEFLSKLNVNTTKFINGPLETFKTDIKSYFLSGLNIEGISSNIELIAKDLFVLPSHLSQEMFDYLYYACGPLSKLELAFNEEIEFHKILSEKKFIFDEGKYQDAFNKSLTEVLSLYDTKRDKLFEDLKVPEVLRDSLLQVILDFINESYESVYEEVNSLSTLTEFEFLDMSFSIREISLDVLHEVKDELVKNVYDKVDEKYNNYLNDLKQLILDDLDEYFKEINKTINYEYLTTTEYYTKMNSKNSDATYEVEFQDVTEEQLKLAVSLFFEKAELVYSKAAITEALNEVQNKIFDDHPFSAAFHEGLKQAVYDDINNISQNSYSRLVEERTIFQANIKIIYETAFRKIFTQFVNNKGKDYLSYSIDLDYQKRIFSDFSLMSASINDTYRFVEALLDTAELKALGYNLAEKFVSMFPDVKEKIQSIIPKKINDIIYPKIELFKDNAQTEIVNLFVKIIEEENKKLESRPKIYDLIPQNLDTPFKAIIASIFDEEIKEQITEMKSTYNSAIMTDLNLVVEEIDHYGGIISDEISLGSITEQNPKWITLKDYYKTLNSALTSYNDNYAFEVSNDKDVYILLFYNNRILPHITAIYNGFYNQVEIGQNQLKTKLQSFKVGDMIKPTLEYVEASEMKINIESVQNQLILLIKNLTNAFVSKFDDLPNWLNSSTENITFNGFGVKSNLRNLEDYDLYEIEDMLKQMENKYKDFKQKVLTKNEYYNIMNSKSAFMTVMHNSASTLTNEFYTYRHLIAQYTDNVKIDRYFELLEKDAKTIRNRVNSFVLNCSNAIKDAIDLVYFGLDDTWYNIRSKINPIMYNALDEIFATKFETIEDVEYSGTAEDKYFKSLTVERVNSNREIITTIDMDINVLESQFGYSIKRLGTYDFTVDVYASSKIDITATTIADNRIREVLSKRLGSGKVGISANYTLHNKNVDVDAYAVLDHIQYSTVAEDIEDWNNIYNLDIEVPERKIHNRRKYRRREYEK